MMKFKKVEIVEIDENKVAEELVDTLIELLEDHDRKFAQEISKKNKLEILNRVGEIWHEKYVQYMIGYTKRGNEYEIF